MDLFIFGTLLHMPLLEVVSGDCDIAKRITWAVRPGYRVSRVDGHEFPMMHEDADSVAEGVVIEGLSDTQLERLDFYEKAFDYDRVDFVVLDKDQAPRSVTAYVPAQGRWTPAEPWNRQQWISELGAVTKIAAREAMAALGTMTAQQMGALYESMMARAASQHRAASSSGGGGMGRADVHLIEARKQYAGFFNVEELDFTFRRFDGSMSEPVNRAVFVGVDAAIVLPYDPVRDRVMLVEQFRPGAYFRGDPNPWTMEPVAGRIDPGEGPEEAAIREAKEEAGINISSLQCVSAAYPSPGSTTEHFYVFIGITDLPDGAEGIAGKLSEAEDIRSQVMDWADFDDALNAGEYRLLPLLVAGHWLARNRETLRASA
ncbi:nudix-type nucleoside diphosphatase, YffH/AdpP family [Octadecabacter temperatus]|uniref:ADP-ribose pyrophosphatase n=1 Tax=Octadecabacter temperatus TaxID=1458307 RepID=A0A0K0Y4J0_9RHOB|nr:NUDIX domain-containing protein [Octadecabacter temperatus]AKS45850.1 ADP-ribose pyrophosphatase [Octadecabacter temperatus]SIO01979.1 nudix-type nucleoside diphosphatase, YffH/AdpP family [Octadecabacter temperatus]